jgi:hypothetical protein
VTDCQRSVVFEPDTGRFETCSATDATPQIIGLLVGGDMHFFRVDLCQFHVIATTFAQNTAEG